MELAKKHCVSCEGDMPPMNRQEAELLLEQVSGWKIDQNQLTKDFNFKNFRQALNFVNRVGEIAEAEAHHPDIYIWYNKVRLNLSTHAAKGLTENDFILAAKVNELIDLEFSKTKTATA